MSLAVPPVSPLVQGHRFSADQYHLMAEAGVLAEADRVELINGEIVDMTPIGREHSSVVDRLAAFLHSASQGKYIVRVQNPILLGDHSEPQPDLAVLKFRSDYYFKQLPGPRDVVMLIEVANTSLDLDRRVKIPHYASVGVPEAWLINLNAKVIDVFRDPVDGQYRQVRTFKRLDSVLPMAFETSVLKVEDIFPE